jgi:hypothetical protein
MVQSWHYLKCEQVEIERPISRLASTVGGYTDFFSSWVG